MLAQQEASHNEHLDQLLKDHLNKTTSNQLNVSLQQNIKEVQQTLKIAEEPEQDLTS